jgi:GT2 family glycosyltransferase
MAEIMTDIIIVSYRDEIPLRACVESIKTFCFDYKIFIHNNNEKNIGFTAACNKLIKEGTGEWVWLLNSDAVVLEGAQQALIDHFSYGPQVGICGSVQLDPENPDIIKHGGTQQILPGVHKGGRVSMGHCRFPEKQTWVNGASMMIRRAMIEKIGLMDESLFLLCSDSDYCLTARKAGWEVWYVPHSKVLHKLNVSKNVSEWHQKDMDAFMNKWGITFNEKTNSFRYSPLFQKLDMFP